MHYKPVGEADNQSIWFAAEMLVENGFIADVESWLTTHLLLLVINDDEVHPDDSVSKVASSNPEWESTRSGKHSHSSVKSTAVCIQVDYGTGYTMFE